MFIFMQTSKSLSYPLYIDIESKLLVDCPPREDGYSLFIPHPSDCSLYYQCAGVSPILMSCPGGLHFDYSVNVCNWPQYVDCDIDAPSQENVNEETTEDIIEIQTTEDEMVTVTEDYTVDIVCPPSEDGFSVFVPHPTDCGLYYHCDGPNPILRPCPPGLHFDTILSVCNWPLNMASNYQNLETNI